MERLFSLTRALVARKRKIFALFFALAASIGMSFAQASIVSSGTKGGMSYTFYDNGLLEISGSGALPGRAFTNWDGGFGTSVKNIRFAEDCEVYGLGDMWFGCYTENSQLETVEINSVVPIMFSASSGEGIFYRQDGAVTLTITAPGIVDVEGEIIGNYGSPVNMILNLPATTVFEKKWFSGLRNNFAVTIPTGAKGHIPAGYSFTNPYDQQEYDHFVEMGHEDDFWDMYSHLVEGVDYTLGVESSFVITAENASQIFGQAAVSFKAPTEASNSEWVLWRKSDLKEFPDMSSGDQKVCKDVTVKVNNGVYNTDSGWGLHFESSGEDGVQFVAPEGKVFKRIVILNEYGTFSDPNWSYDGNYKKWSGSANTVGFVGNICGISLIEFELEASAPANSCGDGLTWEFDPATGALTISYDGEGTGVMNDYSWDPNAAPWYAYKDAITSVSFPEGITTIGAYAFVSCDNAAFTKVTIPEGVTALGVNAFYNCDGIQEITIPSTVTTIDVGAIYDCKAVNSITSYIASPTNLHGFAIYGYKNTCTLYVPYASIDAYKAAECWKNIPNIAAIPGTLTPEGVIEKIAAIGTVEYTAESKAKIDEARAAYDALSDGDKALVTNYSTLTDAETAYAQLLAQAVKAVKDQIDALPATPLTDATKKLSEYNKVLAAREAYDALSDEEKAAVTNLAKLEAVEAAFAAIGGGGGSAPAGALNGKFTINGSSVVYFSKGNLQATYDGSAWSWAFAANQWDYIGNAAANTKINGNGTVSENGTVDLFGWVGASSEFVGLAQYGITSSDATNATDGFGNNASEALKSDWGTTMGEGWFTLSTEQWQYLFNTRFTGTTVNGTANARYTEATINSDAVTPVNGIILFPENASLASVTGVTWGAINETSGWETTCTTAGWTALEEAGCVFLPAAGRRYVTSVFNAGSSGYYWSSSPDPSNVKSAYDVFFRSAEVNPANNNFRSYGYSVRLVTEALASPLADAQAAKDLIDAIPQPVVYTPECGAAIKAAREAVDALGANASLLDEADLNKLTQAETAYAGLLAEKVAPVIAAIDAIPSPIEDNLKLSVYDKVKAAREAYDALTDEEKAAVSNYDKLTAAEAAFAAIPSVGSETVITWDKNTGIEKISGTTTSPAYEGITISIKGGGFGPQDVMLRFNIAGLGLSFEFANTLGGNFQKIVISSTNAMPSTPLGGMGEGWAASSGNKIATWTGDAATVKIWDGLTATSYWDVNTIQFTLGATVSATEAAQAALDKINAIPQPVVYTPECGAAIKAAREAVDALGANASLLDEADLNKLTQAETAYAGLLAEKVAPVIAAIDAIPSPIEDNLKLSVYDKVKAAREAYDALATDEEKAAVTNYDKLEAAEAAFAPYTGGGAAAGALNGKFTINAGGDQIAFAKGNLQATTTDLGANWTWGFAAHQYDFVGDAAANNAINGDKSVSANGSVDIFGWSTEATYYGIHNSEDNATYSGDFKDWGSNIGEGWRTLSSAEWIYLLKTRTDASSKFGMATVADVHGMIVLPDDYAGAAINSARDAWDNNIISASDWAAYEAAGVVFLPAGGNREGKYVYLVGSNGHYWSSTNYGEEEANSIYFGSDFYKADGSFSRKYSHSVRLVTSNEGISPIAAAQAAVALINAIPDSVVYTDACKETIDAARAAVDALGENASLIDDEDMAKLTAAEARYEYLHNRPTPSFNPAPAAIENLKYTGTAQALITAGVATATTGDDVETCTVLYSLNNETYSENIPTGLAIGTYTVYYKVLESETHKAFGPATVNAQILKADAVYTAPAAYDTLVYNAATQTLITAGATEHGIIEYSPDGTNWSTELPTGLNAGTYTVYYRLTGDDFHSDVAATSVEVTIAKAALTATADSKTVTYGDAVPAYAVTYAGWVGGENETVLTGTLTLSCEYEPTSNAGEYAIIPSGVSADNYEITFVNGKLTVNKADAIFTAPKAVAGLVYTSEKQTLVTAGECADGTFLFSLDNTNWVDTLPEVLNAATYTVYYKVQGDQNHNDYIAAEPIEVTIAKAALTITAENKEVVYGFAAPGFSVSYYGLKGSDLPADVLTGELAYACDYTAGSNAGEYDIFPSGQTSANYDITYVKGTLNVLKADPAFTVPVANTLTYNGGAQTLVAAGTTGHGTFEYTFTPNDEESWNTALPQAKNADTYGVYYRVVGDHNHLDYESADAVVVTIAKAALTATADDKNVIYGDAVPAYTVTYAGWQGEDNADVLSGTIAYACEYAPTSNVGDYTIVPSGVSNPDYAITFVNGKVTVSKAALTITADNKEVTYGDKAPAFTVTYEGFKNEDDETVVSGLTLTSEYAPTSNVGDYTIVPANATAQNYDITFVNGTLTVNKAALMITAENKSVEYGEVAPAFTASYSGWKNSDDASVVSGLTLTSEYLVTSNVGTYDIVPANATATNYAISFTNGTLTVNQAPLMITADDKSVIYGEVAPEFTASYSGWKNNDDKSVVSGLTLTSEYLVTSNVGTYDIVPANATATNYAISYTNGTLTVNQAALTITANDTVMIYGDEHPEFTASYSGWKNTDDESVVSGLQFSTPYAPGSYIGTYAINPNSATALNYAITFVDGTLTVNKAHVYVSDAEAQIAKFADGHANAVVLQQGTLNGIKLEDPIGHVTTASFNTADVAEHLTITLYYSLTGDAALLTNYDLQPTSEIFTTEGVIIEPFIPDDQPDEKEDQEAEIEEGIEVYAYGYCDGSGYSLRYHLESGNPDQYKIEFDDPRFTDVDWTDLEITGPDGYISIEIPVDMPTGDYTMTATFRDHRFPWLESKPFVVTFHVNLPETFIRPLFDNTIALVDTCNCFTDIQWYWRASSADLWQPIEGANGYYYHVDGQLTGEYFVSAKMNGEPTYTCGQADMETLYGEDNEQAKIVVKAFPNPVVNTTTVTIENSDAAEHTLRIVNLMGAEVLSATFEGTETKVEMGTFVQGNYMISVDGVTVKVLKK